MTKDIPDHTMQGWRVELTHEDGWDFVQIASVNEKSHLRIEADDDPEQTVPFDGWRVTLDRAGLRNLIDKAHELYDKLPDSAD